MRQDPSGVRRIFKGKEKGKRDLSRFYGLLWRSCDLVPRRKRGG
jgi:hypothetical protein